MKIHKRIAAGALVFAAASSLFFHTASARIATPAATVIAHQPATIPFELHRGNRIILGGRINGIETPMMLDSGAGVTTLDKAYAAKIGLKGGQKITAHGTGGRQDAELFQNVTIEAGNLRLSGVTVVAIDLTQVAKAIGRPMPVVLGRELFVNSVVTLDFDRNEMTLSPSGGFQPPVGATKVKLRRDGTLHYIPVSIAGLPPVDAAFDLGNGGALSLSREYHEQHKLFATLPYAVGMTGGVGGMHESRRVTLPKVEMAGFAFEAVPADLDTQPDAPHAGGANAGIQMFQPFKLTMDLGHDRIWLERHGQHAIFPKDRSGVSALLEDDHLNILHVSPGSPADRAGLKKGDRLIAVDGVKVGPDFFSSDRSGWARAAAGTKVQLTKSDGVSVTLTLADYY